MSDQKLIIGYYRLSMEDDSEGESNSIINQRKLVKDYISNIPELASMPFQEFYDDGYSGSSMERPAIKQVLELARENKVQCIVVKDFSRFARNYIEMGTYLEQIFPFLGVRFISISDRYDSKDYIGKSSDIEVQFKGLIADFYVKDQSVKVKSAVSTRRGKGEYCCGSAPYGYRINPENKKELVIVEDEAEVIRRVFELTNQRYSKMEICRLFNEEGVLTPLQSMSRRQKSDSKKAASRGLQWTSDMIRKIVDDKTYIGCMVYGKTKIPDPGTGKEVPVPRNQWKVMENHHEPIVSKEIFEKAEWLKKFISIDMADGDAQTDAMEQLIETYPDLRIAIGHFGMVTTDGWEKQIALAKHEHVYIESGGITWLFHKEFYPYPSAVRAIRTAIDICGIDKLMWGSDYPRTMTAITYDMSKDFIEKTTELSEEEKIKFLGENARAFYGFEELEVPEKIRNMVE